MEYTSEELNYLRICDIAFNLVPEGLRQVFKQQWDFRYKEKLGEWIDMPKNGSDFNDNESKRSHRNYARYLEEIESGNTAEWDCDSLFFAILFSDSIGTTLSAAVSKDVGDLVRLRKDIIDISDDKLADDEFRNHFERVLQTFYSLSLPDSLIEAIKNEKSFSSAEVRNIMASVTNAQSELEKLRSDLNVARYKIQTKEEHIKCLTEEINSKVKSFCILTPKPAHQIIRRSNDVTRIMAKMQELDDGSNGAVSTIYLSGTPGCGKTQLARQIGEEFFTRGSGESEGSTFVATLNAETLETLAGSFLYLARHLGIAEYTLVKLAGVLEEVNPKERVQKLRCLIFPKFKQFTKWLIIADNVVNLPLVYEHLPQTADEDGGHGRVLITTQDTSAIPINAPHTYHESLSAGMQPADAVELLEQVTQISVDEQAQKVAAVLEYQPLALASAACYLQFVSHRSPTYGWTNYLEKLTAGSREVTEKPLADRNPAYAKTMTAAIKFAIERIMHTDDVLRQTFLFLSLCDSEPLPIQAAVNFVSVRTPGKTDEFIKAKILNSSLIMSLYSEDEAPGYLRVHNAVHQVLREILPMVSKPQYECFSVAVQVFHSLIESEQDRLRESGDVCVMLRRITTHCKALHEILTRTFPAKKVVVEELTPFISPDNLVAWLCSTASVCCELSNPSDAILFSTSACDFVQFTSDTREGDFIKAKVFDVHGFTLSMTCQYRSSISYHKEATKIYKTIYGEHHCKVAASYERLGNVYRHLGQYSEAKEYHEKALIIRKKIFVEEHPDVATSYSNLGNVYQALGQYNEAKEYHEKALIIRKKIFGNEHSDVATSYNNLGVVYRNVGQYNEAKKHYEMALVIREKIFGEEHCDVAAGYNNLGNVYLALGQYNEAKEYHEKALIITKKIFGEEHPDVATSYNNLGNVYEALGQYNEANKYYEKALIITKKIFGEEHPDVATSYSNLGNVYQALGQYNEAKEYHEKALIIRKKIFGNEHSDVATSYNNLGVVYRNVGQYNEAKKHYEMALVIREKIFGEEHCDVAAGYNNLGNVSLALGQYNEAKEYHEKALIIRKKIFGNEHSDVATSYNNLGVVYRNVGQYNEAKKYYEMALVIREKIFGEEHCDVAAGYNNLGNVYLALGQYNEAKEYHEKALIITKKIFGEEHPDVATSYNNLGNVYQALGQYNEAKEYYEKVLIIRKKIFGDEHANLQ